MSEETREVAASVNLRCPFCDTPIVIKASLKMSRDVSQGFRAFAGMGVGVVIRRGRDDTGGLSGGRHLCERQESPAPVGSELPPHPYVTKWIGRES